MNMDSCFKDEWNREEGKTQNIVQILNNATAQHTRNDTRDNKQLYICTDDGLYDMLIDVWAIFTNRPIS